MPNTTSPDICPAQIRELSRELASEIAELPRLSRIVEQFLLQVGRDTATAADIANALELDPVLKAWVLRQANSGFFKLNRPIATAAEACVVLGTEPVTRLVYAACTRDLLQRRLFCYQYPGNGFWLHGLAVGLAARRLAALQGEVSPLGIEAGHVAGLLHDVGKLLLDARLSRKGGRRIVSLEEEFRCTGLDHGILSAAVADSWSLPTEIVMALACHHAEAPLPQARLLATTDLLINHWDVGTAPYPHLDREPPLKDLAKLTAPLGLEPGQIERWCRELPPVIEGLMQMLNAVGHGHPPDIATQPIRAESFPASRTTRCKTTNRRCSASARERRHERRRTRR